MDNKLLVRHNEASLQSSNNDGFKLQKVIRMENSASSNFQPQISFSSNKPATPIPEVQAPS